MAEWKGTEIKFCTLCGGTVTRLVPEDDDHVRDVCTKCGNVHYQNPKMVVGCIPEAGSRILLCLRNIEPAKGKWTLPAGYLENHETVEQGAARETLEETRARVDIISPYRLFNIVHVSQIYLMFRAGLVTEDFGPTSESMDVRLFHEDEIPWDEISFPVIRKTLVHYFKDRQNKDFPFKIGDIYPGKKIIS